MAKNDNIQDFLKDVADAIRAKKGTTDKINPQDFADEIKNIESGTWDELKRVQKKDVNFYDYDGSILYSYTAEQAIALSELPPFVSHENLTQTAWNHTLSEVREMARNCGHASVGAIFTTTDGFTYIYIVLNNTLDVSINLSTWNKGEVSVDWGDGNVEQNSITSGVAFTHTYAKNGRYTIKINRISGTAIFNGFTPNDVVKGVHIGNMTQAGANNLPNALFFTSTTLSNNSSTYYGGWINIPTSVSSCRFSGFGKGITYSPSCANISCISANGLKEFVNNGACSSFNNNFCLEYIYGETPMVAWGISWSPTLRHVQNPIGTEIPDGCFSYSKSLTEFKSPDVTRVGTQAFSYSGIKVLDMSACTSVPTLANANAFLNTSLTEIRVPMALVDEWKAATNWSTYADYIVGY
jgi:hypothetical protein